jgi:putative mycofactocin binding protein MftB
VSTDTSTVGAVSPVYRLHPSVSLRPERFGALAYSFDTRKLSFLKHPDLVAVVESLDGTLTLDEAMDHVGVDPARRGAFVRAAQSLEASGMLLREGATSAT